MAETIGERLERIPRPHGFDYLRLGLALGVLAVHASPISATVGPLEHPLVLPFALMILPMFFALSGFLVAGSYERSRTLGGFLTLRALRLGPALGAEVVLSALILGPLVTTLPLADYFTHSQFWLYFQNLIGHPQYLLPGVFADHPSKAVNGSLWTLPWELLCYVSLWLLAVFGRSRRQLLVPGLIFFIIFGRLVTSQLPVPRWIWPPGTAMVVAFLAGVVLHQYRDRVPRSLVLAVACVGLVYLFYQFRLTRDLAMVPVAYVTVFLGQLHPRRTFFAGGADYSYGVYLFAFPIQQLVQMVPELRSWQTNILCATPLALLFAAASWHLVERPVLMRKERVVARVDAWTLRLRAAIGRPRKA